MSVNNVDAPEHIEWSVSSAAHEQLCRGINVAFRRTGLIRTVFHCATTDREPMQMLDDVAVQAYSILLFRSGEALVDFERKTELGEIAWDSQ